METDSLEDKGKRKRGERKLSALDILVERTLGDVRYVGHPDDPMRETHPELWRWLTTIEAGRDHVMAPGRMSLCATPGGFAVSIVLLDMKYVLETNVPFLGHVFDHLEALLTGANPPIRNIGKKEPKLRKRQRPT